MKKAEKQNIEKETKTDKKVLFLENVYSRYGNFKSGADYEIPETVFSVWEKAGLVKSL